MYLFKCFWDTFASFIGYYEVAQETGAKVVTLKQSHDAFKATSKWPDSNPTACLHLSLSYQSERQCKAHICFRL